MAVRTEEGADPHGAWTAVIGMIMAVAILASVIALQALFYKVERDELQTKVIAAKNEVLVRSVAEQMENLKGYRWIDQSAGQVGIPIEKAMDLIVREDRMIGDQ